MPLREPRSLLRLRRPSAERGPPQHSVGNPPTKLAYLRRSREPSPPRAGWSAASAGAVGDPGPSGKTVRVNDQEVHQQIERLVAEEHTLFEKGSAVSSEERRRLGDINVQLDRLWDLLRQRRGRGEVGEEPRG